jgi:hypothetical protein
MQPDVTRNCVSVIEKYRVDQNVPIETLTQFIGDTSGVPMTFYQYRAMRNGMSKNVPVHVIILAGQFLGIPAHELFPTLDG